MQSSIPFLDNDAIAKQAPAVLANRPHSDVSAKYSFLSTIDVIDLLRGEGWFPVSVRQSTVRRVDRSGFQKHVVRLRRDTHKLSVGELIPECVVTNSMDGLSAYSMSLGIYRCVCNNQMTVSDSLFDTIRLRHVGLTSNDVIEASYRVIADLPKLGESVEQMKATTLNADERRAFAESALIVKYGDEQSPITADAILRPRREEDTNPSLWNVLNISQEHLIRGGLSGRKLGSDGQIRRVKTREIKSVGEDIRVNQALWSLAEKMRAIKSGEQSLLAA